VNAWRPRHRVWALLFALPAPLLTGTAEPPPNDFTLTGTLEQGALVRGVAPPGTSHLTLDGNPVQFDATGYFLIGFDRDHGPNARLVAARHAAAPVQQDVVIAPRAWQIENIDVAPRPEGTTPEQFVRKRAEETRRIEAARKVETGAAGWRQQFILPAAGRVSGVFGSQRVYRGEPGAFHTGLDLAAGAGAPVVAPADGVVVLAGPPAFSLEGNLVIIDHGMGLNSAFLHLATQDVRVGDVVRQGQKIGTVGATGRATGPHLHWSVKWQQARLDPQRLVAR